MLRVKAGALVPIVSGQEPPTGGWERDRYQWWLDRSRVDRMLAGQSLNGDVRIPAVNAAQGWLR